MSAFHSINSHSKAQHKLVLSVLRKIATDSDVPLADVRADFIEGEPHLTALFWHLLGESRPGEFCGVAYCHGCRRFSLTPANYH